MANENSPAHQQDTVLRDLDQRRRAQLAVKQLRRALEADPDTPHLPAGTDLAALVAEYDRMCTLVADSWRHGADLVQAVPHDPSALTGPYWYGQGWDGAVDHLRQLADGVEP